MTGPSGGRFKKLDWPEQKAYRFEATLAGAKVGGIIGAAVFVIGNVLFLLALQEGENRKILFPHMMAMFGVIGFMVGTLVGALVGAAIDRFRG
jgi:hypothetical protein